MTTLFSMNTRYSILCWWSITKKAHINTWVTKFAENKVMIRKISLNLRSVTLPVTKLLLFSPSLFFLSFFSGTGLRIHRSWSLACWLSAWILPNGDLRGRVDAGEKRFDPSYLMLSSVSPNSSHLRSFQQQQSVLICSFVLHFQNQSHCSPLGFQDQEGSTLSSDVWGPTMRDSSPGLLTYRPQPLGSASSWWVWFPHGSDCTSELLWCQQKPGGTISSEAWTPTRQEACFQILGSHNSKLGPLWPQSRERYLLLALSNLCAILLCPFSVLQYNLTNSYIKYPLLKTDYCSHFPD